MTASSGAPFWSGTKRAPSAVSFNSSDSLHLDFIVAAANLQATVYGLKGCQDRGFFLDILPNVVVPHFEPREGVKIAVSDNDLRSIGNQRGTGISGEDSTAADFCEAIFQELPTPATLAGYRLTPVEFDKDDDCNYHAEFVAAAASLRGCNYGIPLTDKLQARYIGGRVVPAIITSTAVVGGLMCLELYKTLQHKPLTCYKHAYFNLAVPLFSFAQPIKAIEHLVTRRQETPLSWTLWDRFELDCIGMSLEGFLAEFKRQQGLEITMISYGRSLLYAEFLPKKKLQDRLPLSLLDLINIIGKVTIPATESKITLSISCTDANEEDVEVPDVVARVR